MLLTVPLSEEETEALRAQAEREGRSMEDVARAAISEYVERAAHRARVAASARDVAERYAEALRRLGDA
jgi:plasmid stability protein